MSYLSMAKNFILIVVFIFLGGFYSVAHTANCNISFSPAPPQCINNQPLFLTGGTPSGGSYSGPGVSAGYFDPSVAGTGIHTLIYEYNDGNGCSGIATQEVTVYSIPTVDAGAGLSLCGGTSVQLMASMSSTASSFEDICIFDAQGGLGNCNFSNNLCSDGLVWSSPGNSFSSSPIYLSSPITSLQFDMHFSCGSNTTFEFFLNGISIGTSPVYYTLEICNCQPQNAGASYPYSRVFSWDDISAAANLNGQNVLTVKYIGSGTIALAGYKARMMFSSSTFNWSPSTGLNNPNILNPIASPENSTTYTLTVTDNTGCSASDELAITVLPTVDFDYLSNNASCFGGNDGSVQVVPVSGTAPFIMSVNNGNYQNLGLAGNLEAGHHFIRLKDSNGCESNSKQVAVSCPAALSSQVFVNPVSCYGLSDGSAEITMEGGTAPYTVYWQQVPASAVVSGLPSGNFSVNVADSNGCISQVGFHVPQPPAIIANAAANLTTVVAGYQPLECTTVSGTSSGGTGSHQYSWSNGASGQSTQVCPESESTYTLTVSDAMGCTQTAQVTIDVLDVRCGNKNDMVQVCNKGNSLCVGSNAAPQLLNISGNYLGPCNLEKDPSSLSTVLKEKEKIKAYPNPSRESTTVVFNSLAKQEINIHLLDLKGNIIRNVYSGIAEENGVSEVPFQTSELADGMYLLRFSDGGTVKYLKFIKAK